MSLKAILPRPGGYRPTWAVAQTFNRVLTNYNVGYGVVEEGGKAKASRYGLEMIHLHNWQLFRRR